MVEVSPVILTVTFFAFILGFGIIVANLLKKRKVPDVFFLLILGLVLGPTFFAHPAVTPYVDITLVDVSQMGIVPDFLRILALILIVFTGTFNMSIRLFKKFSDTALKLALFAPIVSTIFLGVAAVAIFQIDWTFAFLIGAILSGSSEAVVIVFQDTLAKAKDAFTILKLEAILNSPISVLLPLLLLDLVTLTPGSFIDPLKYASDFWLLIAAGTGTGILTGLGAVRFLRGMVKEYSIILLFSIALIAFALAENVGGSGFLAVAVCGFILGNASFKEKKEVQQFDDHFSDMLRISVFVLLGAQVSLFITLEQFVAALLFFGVVFCLRTVFILPLLGKRKSAFTKKDIIILTFIAPKGLDAAATAPLVAAALATAGEVQIAGDIINIVFIVILLSVLASTILAYWISSLITREEQQRIKAPRKTKNNVVLTESVEIEEEDAPELITIESPPATPSQKRRRKQQK